MQPPMKQGSRDDFQTPPEALKPLLKYLKPNWTIWECASGEGNLVKEFKNKGFHVIGSDIHSGKDFLSWQPRPFDCIVTNPPFSLKQEFLERAYCLGKPFAFLLPLTTLETESRQKYFKHCGVEIILFNKRINFITPDGNGDGSWFASAWFTNGLNIGKQLVFERI